MRNHETNDHQRKKRNTDRLLQKVTLRELYKTLEVKEQKWKTQKMDSIIRTKSHSIQ
jgi:hypothetical protein